MRAGKGSGYHATHLKLFELAAVVPAAFPRLGHLLECNEDLSIPLWSRTSTTLHGRQSGAGWKR